MIQFDLVTLTIVNDTIWYGNIDIQLSIKVGSRKKNHIWLILVNNLKSNQAIVIKA
jgi:hypothetical protein